MKMCKLVVMLLLLIMISSTASAGGKTIVYGYDSAGFQVYMKISGYESYVMLEPQILYRNAVSEPYPWTVDYQMPYQPFMLKVKTLLNLPAGCKKSESCAGAPGIPKQQCEHLVLCDKTFQTISHEVGPVELDNNHDLCIWMHDGGKIKYEVIKSSKDCLETIKSWQKDYYHFSMEGYAQSKQNFYACATSSAGASVCTPWHLTKDKTNYIKSKTNLFKSGEDFQLTVQSFESDTAKKIIYEEMIPMPTTDSKICFWVLENGSVSINQASPNINCADIAPEGKQ